MVYFLLFIPLFIAPSAAYALPTPDAIISLVNIVPLLTGTAAAISGGFYLSLKRFFGTQGSYIFLATLLSLFFLFIALLQIYAAEKRQNRVEEIAIYLRADPAAHEARVKLESLRIPNSLELWGQYGNFKLTEMPKLRYMLRIQPDALLIDTTDREIRYHAGVPAVAFRDHIRPFVHVRAAELTKTLRSSKEKDLYLYDFPFIHRDPKYFPGDLSIFKKFDNIYLVRMVEKKHLFISDKHGNYLPAKPEKIIKWPVETATWVYDERAIIFPNMTKLIPNKKAAALLYDKDVLFVAPYATYRRSDTIHKKQYLPRLFSGLDRSRVLSVDMTTPNTSAQLQEIAEKIDGKRFMIIGWAKHDWLYEGLDAGFALWNLLDRDKNRFRLIGSNTRLPEVVAINWEKRRSQGFLVSLRKPFWKIVRSVHEKTSLDYGFIIFLLAVGLRLILSPIGLAESCSRFKRNMITRLGKQKPTPVWQSSTQTLQNLTGVNSTWELAGGFITLLLILPAYTILSAPPKFIPTMNFLWIRDLMQPDYISSILAGILIYSKIKLSSSSTRNWLQILITVIFTVILCFLPAVLMVYLCGVLFITLGQDIVALKKSQIIIDRALLKQI